VLLTFTLTLQFEDRSAYRNPFEPEVTRLTQCGVIEVWRSARKSSRERNQNNTDFLVGAGKWVAVFSAVCAPVPVLPYRL